MRKSHHIFLGVAGAVFLFVIALYSGNFLFGKGIPVEQVYEERAVVAAIVDGDTFVLNDGRTVRLLGMDTPERGEPLYGDARKRLEELSLGKEVMLTKDVRVADKYNRILRYVFVDEQFVNKILVEEGFAKILTIPPDIYYAEELREAQKKARNEKRGLWQ